MIAVFIFSTVLLLMMFSAIFKLGDLSKIELLESDLLVIDPFFHYGEPVELNSGYYLNNGVIVDIHDMKFRFEDGTAMPLGNLKIKSMNIVENVDVYSETNKISIPAKLLYVELESNKLSFGNRIKLSMYKNIGGH